MASPSVDDVNLARAEQLCAWLRETQGCLATRVLPDGSVAALKELLFTRAIHVGCAGEGWAHRFCFADRALASQRFAELQSEDDVPVGHVATRVGLHAK